jgi:hypothetical protein
VLRRFELIRDVDETGISGTGKVAEGVIYSNGWCSMMWTTSTWSMVTYPDIDSVIAIHGHGGKTRIVYLDGEPYDPDYPKEVWPTGTEEEAT